MIERLGQTNRRERSDRSRETTPIFNPLLQEKRALERKNLPEKEVFDIENKYRQKSEAIHKMAQAAQNEVMSHHNKANTMDIYDEISSYIQEETDRVIEFIERAREASKEVMKRTREYDVVSEKFPPTENMRNAIILEALKEEKMQDKNAKEAISSFTSFMQSGQSKGRLGHERSRQRQEFIDQVRDRMIWSEGDYDDE